jgi:hypothetical protein
VSGTESAPIHGRALETVSSAPGGRLAQHPRLSGHGGLEGQDKQDCDEPPPSVVGSRNHPARIPEVNTDVLAFLISSE